MKKPAVLIFSLILVTMVLAVIRTSIANNIATSGVVLGQIEEHTDSYKLENSILSEKLYSLSSLTNVERKAYDLGYRDQVPDLVLTKQAVAIKQ